MKYTWIRRKCDHCRYCDRVEYAGGYCKNEESKWCGEFRGTLDGCWVKKKKLSKNGIGGINAMWILITISVLYGLYLTNNLMCLWIYVFPAVIELINLLIDKC